MNGRMCLRLTEKQMTSVFPGLVGLSIYNALHKIGEEYDAASKFFQAIKQYCPNYPPFSKRLVRGLNSLYSGLDPSHQSKKNLLSMINAARYCLSSKTVQGILSTTAYIIDGFITGNGKSAIYYLFKHTMPFSGKIMEKQYYENELEMMKAVGKCRWIVPLIDTFQVDEELWAIVMPVYTKNVSQLMEIWETSNSYKPDCQSIVNVFFSLLKALKHLSVLRIAHCDIKTENLMIDYNGNVVLIDFGAATFYGQEVFESLDVIETDKHEHFQIAGLQIDLLCMATTLVKMGTGKIGTKKLVGLRAKIRDHLKEEDCELFYQFANLCLNTLENRTQSLDTTHLEHIWMEAAQIAKEYRLPAEWSE
eukprot:TRINITY_DN17658_c0_g1_i2.p1 TRINITY_DN17658_c0_g1~~TRINITY_DN17658_c0_g1_i2.p1  ORF type:complete len:409 (+),score=50.93 TRINITY_DN17658_c0_g1_i2:139-1227(+)